MKIAAFSDTHGMPSLKKLYWPKADVVICAGDFSNYGNMEDACIFMEEYKTLPYKYRVFVAGNHDRFFEREPGLAASIAKDNKLIYLFDNFVKIEGYKIYGTPWQPPFRDWAFNVMEDKLVQKFSIIPEDVDVLVTHCPPRDIMDTAPNGYRCGSTSLRDRIKDIKPKLHVFGHMHGGSGMRKINGTIYANCSILDDEYCYKHDPKLIEL